MSIYHDFRKLFKNNLRINILDFSQSTIESIGYQGREYFLKRDDLIHPFFNGNKGRKLFFLLQETPKKITTFGGSQSNMIPPLCFLAKTFNIEIDYYTKTIAKTLKDNPCGNYEIGKEEINFIEIEPVKWEETTKDLTKKSYEKDHVFIPQGALQKEAEIGIKLLCGEIIDFAQKKKIKNLNIFLSSGTGATALFLQQNLPFRVFTTPCVGDKDYLLKQFLTIEEDITKHPVILDTPKKYHFAKPYPEFLKIFLDLKRATGITFDLLYDPKGWKVLDIFRENLQGDVLYIHQGGILGNSSQLLRYRHEGLL